MTERSLRVLEFGKIRARLAKYCQSDMGAALCDGLIPSNSIEDVRRMQQESREAHDILTYLGGTPMVAFSDVRASLHLAEIGSTLSPRALMDIGASLRAARAARDAIVSEREGTPMTRLPTGPAASCLPFAARCAPATSASGSGSTA